MQASKKLRHIQWISIFFPMLAGCISDLDRRALSIAKSAIRGEIEVSAAQMGAAVVDLLDGVCAQVIVDRRADRHLRCVGRDQLVDRAAASHCADTDDRLIRHVRRDRGARRDGSARRYVRLTVTASRSG